MDTIQRTKDIVSKVQTIELRARRAVEAGMSGAWRSVFRGRGMDFEEVRPYAPGDEVRTIDWNVTARTGAPHVKQFSEERDLTLMLLVDVSASTLFGSGVAGSNRELIAEIAGVLALSAERQNDAVGLVLFTDRVEKFVPPGKGREHALRVLREILACEPEGKGTDIGVALDLLRAFNVRRSMTLLVSDFADFAGPIAEDLAKKLRIARQRHDVIGVAVNDAMDFDPPAIGPILFEDLENGDEVELDLRSARTRRAWQQAAIENRTQLRRSLRRLDIGLYEMRTGQPYLSELMRMFHGKAHEEAAIR